MDKQEKKISIKINGQNRPVIDQVHEQDDESRQLYNESRAESILETAASQESIKEDFDWVLPDPIKEEAVREYKIASKMPEPRKKNLPISVWNQKNSRKERLFPKIFLTIFLAVLLGTAFGVTILQFVTAEPETASPVPVTGTPTPASEKPVGGSESIDLGTIVAYVVQNGLFSTEISAKERVALLKGQDIVAEVFPINGQFAVYVGSAGSLEEAKIEAEALKEKGVEVFAKPIEIPGRTVGELTKEQADFLMEIPKIYLILSSGASATQEEIKKIEDFHATIGKLDDHLLKDQAVLKVKKNMESATTTFIAYQKTKKTNLLVEMEGDLLALLSAYYSIGN